MLLSAELIHCYLNFPLPHLSDRLGCFCSAAWPHPQTWLVHNRQGWHASFYKDIQGFDDGRVRVNEGDVVVRPDAKGSQVLLHEGRLWHIRHLNGERNTNALEPRQTFLMFTCPQLNEKLCTTNESPLTFYLEGGINMKILHIRIVSFLQTSLYACA